ncbi:MAG: DivIVA domain-containing protein [Armatimonadetes bacterium]|nr:DivIVA domain-containing protein [Armatimonadota bacterium]
MNPEELNSGSFPRAFRGYDRASVDALLARASAEYSVLVRDLAQLNDRVLELEAGLAAYRAREESISAAIVSAQQTAESIHEQAKRQAQAILEDARKRAEEQEARLQKRLNELRWEYEKLSIQQRNCVESFRSLLEDHLESLAGDPRAKPPPQPTNGAAALLAKAPEPDLPTEAVKPEPDAVPEVGLAPEGEPAE